MVVGITPRPLHEGVVLSSGSQVIPTACLKGLKPTGHLSVNEGSQRELVMLWGDTAVLLLGSSAPMPTCLCQGSAHQKGDTGSQAQRPQVL